MTWYWWMMSLCFNRYDNVPSVASLKAGSVTAECGYLKCRPRQRCEQCDHQHHHQTPSDPGWDIGNYLHYISTYLQYIYTISIQYLQYVPYIILPLPLGHWMFSVWTVEHAVHYSDHAGYECGGRYHLIFPNIHEECNPTKNEWL